MNCVSQRVNPASTLALAFGNVGAGASVSLLLTFDDVQFIPLVDCAVVAPAEALPAGITLFADIVNGNQLSVTAVNPTAGIVAVGNIDVVVRILKGTGQMIGCTVEAPTLFADFVVGPDMAIEGFQFPDNPADTNCLTLRLREWDGAVFTDRDFVWRQDEPSSAGVFGFTNATTPEEMADIMAAQIAADTGFIVAHTVGTDSFRITQPVPGGDPALAKMLWFATLNGAFVLGPVWPSDITVNGDFAPDADDVDGSKAGGTISVTAAGFDSTTYVGLTLALGFNTGTGATPIELRSVIMQEAPLPPDTPTEVYIAIDPGVTTAAQLSAAMEAAWDELGFTVTNVSPTSFQIQQVNDGPAGLTFLQMSGTYTDATRIVFQTVALPAGTGVNRSERCLAVGVGTNEMSR